MGAGPLHPARPRRPCPRRPRRRSRTRLLQPQHGPVGRASPEPTRTSFSKRLSLSLSREAERGRERERETRTQKKLGERQTALSPGPRERPSEKKRRSPRYLSHGTRQTQIDPASRSRVLSRARRNAKLRRLLSRAHGTSAGTREDPARASLYELNREWLERHLGPPSAGASMKFLLGCFLFFHVGSPYRPSRTHFSLERERERERRQILRAQLWCVILSRSRENRAAYRKRRDPGVFEGLAEFQRDRANVCVCVFQKMARVKLLRVVNSPSDAGCRRCSSTGAALNSSRAPAFFSLNEKPAFFSTQVSVGGRGHLAASRRRGKETALVVLFRRTPK